MRKYSCYEYEIHPYYEETNAEYYTNRSGPDTVTRYTYTIDCEGHDIESDEWYHTEQEAIEAACNHIDRLEDGPDEPDYDAPTAHETYMKAHEDRQKLRGY